MINNGGTFNLGSASSPNFVLLGGRYRVFASSTWSGGNIDLQALGPDGSAFISVLSAAFTANGSVEIGLAPGTYRFAVTTATAAFASIAPLASGPSS